MHDASRAAPALLTDLYQLTMLDAYYRLGMTEPAVFEFYVRRLPDCRNFLVAAGLEQVLDYLETLQFTPAELQWLAATQRLSVAALERLQTLRFTGSVHAMREGTVFFAKQPVLRITAPLPEAQLIESRIMNLMHYQIMVAAKAARCRLAAGPKQLVDFGMRRAHGAEAALLGSRASYIAGFEATATVAAAQRFDIPVVGTMAHSFIQAHELEMEAFRHFARCHPDNVTLLIDTYDITTGARRAAQLARELRQQGIKVRGVRIDSGDLARASVQVREILDAAGCAEVRILVSGGLDEHAIAALRLAVAPVDVFCVGTSLSVGSDAPALDCAYKLHEYAGRPCRKQSLGKETWPGPHQVYRQYDRHGRIALDMLCGADEVAAGQPLLHEVMTHGRRRAPSPELGEVRRHCAQELASLPVEAQALQALGRALTDVSPRQHELAAAVDRTAR
jgi:nicotinate phosphoribosyltransferase